MKKITKKSILMASAIVSALCAGLAVSTINTASAETPAISNFYIAGGSVSYMTKEQSGRDENGIRFAVAIEENLYNSLLNEEQEGFKSTVKVGGLVLPADLTSESELTKETSTSIQEVSLGFENFNTDASMNEFAGLQIAYITLQNFPVSDYNRVYMISAYYQDGDNEIVYTDTVTACMAQVAKEAAKLETDESKKAGLLSYVKEYGVNVYVDGEKEKDFGVEYGEVFSEDKLPAANEYRSFAWYADEEFQTPYDFEAPILKTTNVYGKTLTVSAQTGGVLVSMDDTFVYDAENKTFTQTLLNNTGKKGYAAFDVAAGSDFYVSTDISLQRWFKVASQGWSGENDRIGFALVNEKNENYRMQIRSVMLAIQAYGKSGALYNDEGVNATYLLGFENGTTNDVYNKETPYIQLKNTRNLNEVQTVNIAMAKVGTSLLFYVNGELVASQEVEADFNGVPALFAYSYQDKPAQTVTYSNVVVKTNISAAFLDKTSDFSNDDNGNLTHTLTKNSGGFAQFNVDPAKDYTVRFTATFSSPIAYENGQSAGGEAGHNNRIGVTFYGGESGTSYNFALSMVWRNAVRIINESGKGLYNDTAYTLTAGGDARKSFYDVRNKFATMGDTKVDIVMTKVGNEISVYFNNYKLETLTIAEGESVIPAILSYDLQDSNNAMTVTYSNMFIVQ